MPISTGNVNQNLQLLMKPHKHKLTQIPNTPKGTFFHKHQQKKKVYYLLTLTLDKTLPSNSCSLSLSHTSKVQNYTKSFAVLLTFSG
jgi:hypothetical protein